MRHKNVGTVTKSAYSDNTAPCSELPICYSMGQAGDEIYSQQNETIDSNLQTQTVSGLTLFLLLSICRLIYHAETELV